MQFELEFDQPVKKQERKPPAAASMVVLETGTSTRKKTPLEKRFQKLWGQLDKKQQRNASFDALYEKATTYLHTELSQSRIAYRQALVEQTEKLIGHIRKKSLAKWQREELSRWVEYNLSTLDTYGASEVDSLAAQYSDANMAAFIDAHKSRIEQELEMSVEEFAEAIDQMGSEEPEDDDLDVDDFFDEELFDEEPAKDNSQSYRDNSSSDAGQAQFDTRQSRAQFDKTVLNKLFRKTAKALHPDHELDPDLRETKQALMKTLLAARNSGDVITILRLYREHVSDEAMEIGSGDLKPMIELLQRRLDDLDQQYQEMAFCSPTHQWVQQHLVGKNDALQSHALNSLKQDVEEDLHNLLALKPHLQSLKRLKPVLEARYDQNRFIYY